ncbi:hypothetical protein AB0J81_13655 [Streptomyces bobili]|uniref:hypothetical protein n=1 Tax=Streptomyces bobili TaxID=67280 RepID=UPI003447549E
MAFNLPELRDSVGVRVDDQFRKDLNILMTARRETSVSQIIKWAVAQQAEPVRQQWQAAIERRAKENDG